TVLPGGAMRPLARVLVDESHRQAWSIRPEVAQAMSPANPADSSYAEAARELREAGFTVDAHVSGALTPQTLADVDVLVLPHCSEDAWEATVGIGSPVYEPAEIEAIEEFVRAGGGLVVLAETEQGKYGNSLGDIAERFGVSVVNATAQDPVHRFNDVSTWVRLDPASAQGSNVFAGVAEACLYRAGVLQVDAEQPYVFARTFDTASPAEAPVMVGVDAGFGRVLVVADSDFAGDDSIDDLDHRALWRQLVTWASARRAREQRSTVESPVTASPAWERLVIAVEALRPLQAKDGSIAGDQTIASARIDDIIVALRDLAPLVPHQAAYLDAVIVDFERWRSEGLGVPDFLDSLQKFHPEADRRDGVEHLVVFPMYTQNGNPNRNVEAVVVRTVWPAWIAELEATAYDNAAFVPIEFVGFTSGYDTHSAVLFPETVATREVVPFSWGGIFCDREAARFRRVSQAAADQLRLALPPEAELLLNDQSLAQETFVLWDLVHDRTHSHGDLPFDPFMIKQRMPYWMYALEELRCDLATFRETEILEERGVVLAPYVRIAILFDRLFRFPTTGDRVRNYDGLAGQIIFAWLHKNDVIRWTDNTLRVDWSRVQGSINALCEEVETLYREGIDRSRLGHWLAAYAFVSSLVPPHPQSAWAKGADALPSELKEAVDAVLPDEFPLNVFYESLRKALSPTIESARGITGVSA
ncbi:MAG: DUF6421 family protein, partial [Candidatus Nanopelagicales bacterium]